MDDLSNVKKRGISSMISLFLNSSYSALLGYIAFFILTIKSGVFLLGIYNTVLAMMSFFNYMTNMGLAAALIHKKDVKEIDLNTVFILQMALAIVASILGFVLTDSLFRFYKDLPFSARYLYWSVLISFLFLSLKTIPSVLLEKKVQIYKVVFIQALENTVFYLVIIIMLFLGFEMESLVVSVLLRSLIGCVGIFIMNPWRPRLQFSVSSAKELLKYGIPFQSNSFLALIKDDLLIMYLGGTIGLTNLGYVSFAKKYGEFLLRLIMDNANRVFFPIYAMLQNEKEKLQKAVNRQVYFQSIVLFPSIIGLLFVFEKFISLFPEYYLKWKPSFFSFYFFALSTIFISLSSTFTNIFNAIGRLKISIGLMIFWTIGSWTLNFLGIKLFGYQGVSIAFFTLSLTFVLTIYLAKSKLDVGIWSAIKNPFFSVSLMTIFLLISQLFIYIVKDRIIQLVLLISIGTTSYIASVVVLEGKRLFQDIKSFLSLYTKHE